MLNRTEERVGEKYLHGEKAVKKTLKLQAAGLRKMTRNRKRIHERVMNEDTLLLPNLLWKVATSCCYIYKADWDWKMGSTELLKYTPNAYYQEMSSWWRTRNEIHHSNSPLRGLNRSQEWKRKPWKCTEYILKYPKYLRSARTSSILACHLAISQPVLNPAMTNIPCLPQCSKPGRADGAREISH